MTSYCPRVAPRKCKEATGCCFGLGAQDSVLGRRVTRIEPLVGPEKNSIKQMAHHYLFALIEFFIGATIRPTQSRRGWP
jgi:hypothetical protein